MVVLFTVIMLLAGLSGVMLTRGHSGHQAMSSGLHASKLLFVAEAGLNYNFVRMEQDTEYMVKDTVNFNWDATDQSYASPSLVLDSGGSGQSFQYSVQFLDAGAPIAFADRASPAEPYDQIKVTCSASTARSDRIVAAWYTYSAGGAIGGAVVSDMSPTGNLDDGKSRAKKGHIVINGKG
ncbi:MAG: hypothetical protein V3U11_09730, partial [Planctomycetota bacterium]